MAIEESRLLAAHVSVRDAVAVPNVLHLFPRQLGFVTVYVVWKAPLLFVYSPKHSAPGYQGCGGLNELLVEVFVVQ